nr:unnamed protein product [Callosobruchus chinensis]
MRPRCCYRIVVVVDRLVSFVYFSCRRSVSAAPGSRTARYFCFDCFLFTLCEVTRGSVLTGQLVPTGVLVTGVLVGIASSLVLRNTASRSSATRTTKM